MRKIFLISILSMAFIGCGSDNFAPENENNNNIPNPLSTNDDGSGFFSEDIEFITLSQAYISPYEETPQFIPNRVIQTSESWGALLTQIEELASIAGDEVIDFETEQIVYCVYLDCHYTTNITSVTEYEDNVVVKVDYFDNENCPMGTIRYYYHLIKMPKTDKEVVFEIEYESEPPYIYYQ